MPKRLDGREAADRMRASGAEPQTPYPGVDAPWDCLCLQCGEPCRPRLSAMGRQGPCVPCGRLKVNASMRLSVDTAAAVMRSAGLEPQVDIRVRPKAGSRSAHDAARLFLRVTGPFAAVEGVTIVRRLPEARPNGD